ncbi:MAG: glycosyltransferase family 39 protein [Patescibacteria group bacterium]
MKKFLSHFRFPILEIVVFLSMVFLRLPDLGRENFNTDVWKWKQRTYNFLNSVTSVDLKGTIQSYHPGVSLTVLGSLGVKSESFYQKYVLGRKLVQNDLIFSLHFFQKLWVVIAISLLLTISFYYLKKYFGLLLALIFLLLLDTEPFFLFHTREFHLEGLMSLFMFVTVLLFFGFLIENRRKYFVFSSVFASLALLTKSSAFFLFPFVGLMLFVHKLLKKEQNSLTVLKEFLIFTLLVAACFVILWPAMWVSPVETLSSYFRGATEVGLEGDHLQLYFGKLVADPGVSFYPLNIFLRVTPLVLLIFVLSGLVFCFGRDKQFYFSKLLRNDFVSSFAFLNSFLFVVFFLLFLSIPTKKLDRYILPMFPFLVLSASLALSSIFRILSSKIHIKIEKPFYIFLVIVFLRVAQLGFVHPNYLFYYNPLVGFDKAKFMVEPKWAFAGMAVKEFFTSTITRQTGSNQLIAFPEKYYIQLYPFIEEVDGAKPVIMDIKKDAGRATFFVYPTWDDVALQNTDFNLYFYDSIRFRGNAIYNVYKRLE